MVVFLIGFMGSGKTYSASRLSKQLGVPHIDLDKWIEQNEGMTISGIFAQKGEDYFRHAETTALHRVVAEAKGTAEGKAGQTHTPDHIIGKLNILAVVSVGGGTPCFHGNMDWMNSHGFTIWMDPPVKEIIRRLRTEADKRPLIAPLNGMELETFVQQKLAERKKFYSKARFRVENNQELSEQILNELYPMHRTFFKVAAVFSMLSVALGAFGAHLFKKILSPEHLNSFETAVNYQMIHGIALFIVGLMYRHYANKKMKLSGQLFIIGTILFSGSIYLWLLMSYLEVPYSTGIIMITPLGGLLLILGWLSMLLAIPTRKLYTKKEDSDS